MENNTSSESNTDTTKKSHEVTTLANDTALDSPQKKSGLFSRIYFFIFCIWFISYLGKPLSWFSALSIVIDTVTILALYGYAFQKAVFTQFFWKIVFIGQVILSIIKIIPLFFYAQGYISFIKNNNISPFFANKVNVVSLFDIVPQMGLHISLLGFMLYMLFIYAFTKISSDATQDN